MPKSHIYVLFKDDHIIHMIGSNHDADFKALPEVARLFVTEKHTRIVVESKDIRKPFTLDELRELGVIKDGEEDILGSFDHEIKAVIYDKISKFLEFKGNDPSIISQLNYTGLHKFFEFAVSFEHGMDYHLVREFSKFGEVAGLESRGALKAYFKPETREEFVRFITEYKDKRTDIFKKEIQTKFYTQDLYSGKQEVDTEALVERNTKWLPEIKELTDSDIICVGLAHLYGEKGLLNTLRSEGYEIYQLVGRSFEPAVDSELIAGFRREATPEELELIKKEAAESAIYSATGQLGWQGVYGQDGGAASSAYPSNDVSQEPCLVGAGSKEVGDTE